MHKSSFFAFLAVFLLILLGLKGFHLLQYRPWHADGHFVICPRPPAQPKSKTDISAGMNAPSVAAAARRKWTWPSAGSWMPMPRQPPRPVIPMPPKPAKLFLPPAG